MRIAFTHNLRLTDSEEEAEFDSAETVDAIAAGLRAGGHEVEKVEVTGPASRLAERIESFSPDLIFNTAEGRRGRAREAFYPALFEELGFPYTGSDAYVLTVTLDKWLTKLVLGREGIDSPKARLITARDLPLLDKIEGSLGVPDVGRVDFRLGDDGRIYFLEVNALPSLEPGASLFAAAKREGLAYDQTIDRVVKSAAVRWGLHPPSPSDHPVARKRSDKLR